tara:strand:+ start:1714 stop:2412 length:699 start_codon:yes stop_codon:yes gene_type:complete
VQGDPTNDVVFLVHLARVYAAIGRANHHKLEAGMSNPFTAEVLAGYAAIDPFVKGKSNADLSMQPLLSEVAAPEAFAVITAQTSAARKQRNAIHQQFKTLILRGDAIITERFPSSRSSALAMSVVLGEAGELLRTGLSDSGQILDVAKYRDAVALIEAALRLRVKKVASCQRSRDAIKQLKSNGPVGDLVDRLIIGSDTGKVNANAGDVFDAARKLKQLGTSLPEHDDKICQ